MTQDHPITPPLKLVQQWWTEFERTEPDTDSLVFIATQAARWGADQELEACCALADERLQDGTSLRAARRPKPPSLKEQALQAWCRFQASDHTTADEMMSDFTTIRRALETLDD